MDSICKREISACAPSPRKVVNAATAMDKGLYFALTINALPI